MISDGKLYVKLDDGKYSELCEVGEHVAELQTSEEKEKDCAQTLHFEHSFECELTEESLHILDLLIHPFLLVCHPDDEKELKKAKIDPRFKIISAPYAERGKVVIVDRKKMEDLI